MNPLDPEYIASGTATPSGPASPSNQMSPPPSYHEIPGTVPAHQVEFLGFFIFCYAATMN